MKKAFFTMLGFLLFSSLIAQTQSEMNESVMKDYKMSDQELNSVYNQILIDYKDDINFIAKLKTSQLQWIRFRDTELEMKYPEPDKQASYGTMFPMCKYSYLALLTEERTKKLKEWLTPRMDGEGCSGSVKDRDVINNVWKVERIKDIKFAEFISYLEILKEFKTNDLIVRIIQVSNKSGSAGFPNGEVTHNLYISVSEFGEYYIGNVFMIPNLYNIKIGKIETTNLKGPTIEISFGRSEPQETVKLILTTAEIKKAGR
jgi:uncharacterized protein YecT (DUF1311 family)